MDSDGDEEMRFRLSPIPDRPAFQTSFGSTKELVLSEEKFKIGNDELEKVYGSKVALQRLRSLEDRDRQLRSKLAKSSNIKSKVKGTCPDMCPEKERYLRDVKRIVSVYETSENGSLDHNKAVKEYKRSSADQEEPLPHELRPQPVLSMTMAYLVNEILNKIDEDDPNLGLWYDFCWNRLRAIRKDIVQQQLCDLETVYIVEQCARFHICCYDRFLGQDMSVFDDKINTENLMNCLQMLTHMYADLRKMGTQCEGEPEFTAYKILLKLNSGDVLWEHQQYPPALKNCHQVRMAIRLHSAFSNNFYSQYCRIMKSASYLNACLMQRFLPFVRAGALETIIRSYCPPNKQVLISIRSIKRLLYFDSIEETVSFCEVYGILPVSGSDFQMSRADFLYPDSQVKMDSSSLIVVNKRISVPQAVVGVGKPIPVHSSHEVHSSFLSNGSLKSDAIDASDQEDRMLRDNVARSMDVKTSTHTQAVNFSFNLNQEAVSDVKLITNDFSNEPMEESDVASEGQDLIEGMSEDEAPEISSDEELSGDDLDEQPQSESELDEFENDDVESEPAPPTPKLPAFNFALPLPRTPSVEKPSPEKKKLKTPSPRAEHMNASIFTFPQHQPVVSQAKRPVKTPDAIIPSPLPLPTPPTPVVKKDSKLQRLIRERIKLSYARKCARKWKSRVLASKAERQPVLSIFPQMPVDFHIKLWGSSRRQSFSTLQRSKNLLKSTVFASKILYTDCVDKLDPSVKLIGQATSNLLAKASLEHAWKYGNVAQPSPVFWKLVFSIPDDPPGGSTFPSKLRQWSQQAFYVQSTEIGSVEARLTPHGVPVYLCVQIVKGLQSEPARNLSALIFLHAKDWETPSTTEKRLTQLLQMKNHQIPLALVSLDRTNPRIIDVQDLKDQVTCSFKHKWSGPEDMYEIIAQLTENTFMFNLKVRPLVMVVQILCEEFLDLVFEDSASNDGLYLLCTEPNPIIKLYNLLVDQIKAILMSCYTSNIFGTAIEFKSHAQKEILKLIPDFEVDCQSAAIHSALSNLKLPEWKWPPQSSLKLLADLQDYCGQVQAPLGTLSQVVRAINPPDDDDTTKDLITHLSQIKWIHLIEIFVKCRIRQLPTHLNIVYCESKLKSLTKSRWWMDTQLVLEANKIFLDTAF